MNNVNTQIVQETTSQEQVAVRPIANVVKCKPGQGKLNRLVVKAQVLLQTMGHKKLRFKRDYADGKATYTCTDCGAIVLVAINENNKITGNALFSKCVKGSV